MEATGESTAAKLARTVSLALAAALAAMVVQQFFGFGFERVLPIENSKLRPDEKAWRIKLPDDYQNSVMMSRGTVLEDGEPLPNRGSHTRTIRERGAGWFAFHAGGVWFAPADGSDPTTNGRAYTAVVPQQIEESALWPAILIALAIALVILKRLGGGDSGRDSPVEPLLNRISVPVSTLVLFAAAFLIAQLRMQANAEFTDSALCLKGVPESDAMGWHEMAMGFAEGKGITTVFQSNRPLYAVLLAPLYWLCGPQIAMAKLLHCLGLAVAVAAVWLMGCCLRERRAGLAAAASVLLFSDHEGLAHMIVTENAGLCLAAIALLAVFAGIWHLSPWWCGLAGFLNAAGNLASGAMLLTLPFTAVIVLLNPISRRAPWQRAAWMAAAFVLGASLVILPWMARQKVTNQNFTFALNTAELLYAGAHPDHRKLNKEVFTEATAAGIDLEDPSATYRFYKQRFVEIVSADPLRYGRQVIGAAVASFQSIFLRDSSVQTAGLLLLLAVAMAAALNGQGPGRFFAALLIGLAWVNMPADAALPVLAVSFYLAWRRARFPEERLMLVLLAASIAATALLSGMAGNVAPRRQWVVGDWAAHLLIMLGLLRAVQTGGDALSALLEKIGPLRFLAAPAADDEPRGAEDAMPVMKSAAVSSAIWVTGSIILCLVLTIRGEKPPMPGFGEVLKPASIEALAKAGPRQIQAAAGKSGVQAMLARLDDLVIHLGPGEEFNHWLPWYERRSNERAVAHLFRLDDEGIRRSFVSLLINGDLAAAPRGEPLVWLYRETDGIHGITGAPEKIREAVAACPVKQDGNGWAIDASRAVWFNGGTDAGPSIK